MSSSGDNLDQLLQQLRVLQSSMLQQLQVFGQHCYQQQYHQDLSPLGWHVGHCVYTENYWIREAWLQVERCDDELKSLYIPELSNKAKRGQRLPELSELQDWSDSCLQQNTRYILDNADSHHQLMHRQFLIHFLIQHYCQHLETIAMIRQQKQLADFAHTQGKDHTDSATTQSKPVVMTTVSALPSGDYAIGSAPEKLYYYDNERPAFHCALEQCDIATTPVNNHQFVQFITAGGYQDRTFWSEQGWNWLQEHRIDKPLHWINTGNQYLELTDAGVIALRPQQPLYGINYFEAEAFAHYAGGRLPHEHEWEAAAGLGLLRDTGQAWEWCANTFAPYPGFAAYPYDGYSLPYFDQQHYVLKGGSLHSHAIIKRNSFRNFYQGDKRHIFAGLRLAYS